MARASLQLALATAFLLLNCLRGSAAAASRRARGRRLLQDTAVYELVEYVGTSGSTLIPADIAKFPKPPSSVRLTWVIAFVGDATSTTTPSGKFACTGGSFCSGSNLDQTLVTALKGVSNAQVYAGLGGANYPNWPTSSASGYANTAAQSLIAYAKANNLDGYDLDFENGLNADWVTQWTQIIPQLGKAGIPVTIDPFYATKQIYGQLYAALAKQPATGTFIGPQVSGVNYQAYADDSGNAESEQSVLNDLTSGDSSVLSEFQVSQGQEIIFGVAPNRPGPESNPPVATSCAGIERIVDIVCPALRDCSKNKCTYTTYWAFGIMVFDFDTELKLGQFTLVNAAYQALSGNCASIKKC